MSARDTDTKAGRTIAAAATLPEIFSRGPRARWWVRKGSKSRGFRYETTDGKPVREEAAIERIKSLAIPPAWKEVRVAPGPKGRVQAVGLDAAGRVQRIYHPAFAARRQQLKYEKIERFGEALARLRQKTNEDIAGEKLTRERVLAVIIRLINDLYFRVGSEESVKRYRTYGVTTLRNQHLEIRRGGKLEFNFVGKHHIRHRRLFVDAELAALMGDIKSQPGRRLFQYRDADGKLRPVTPRDVNEYIKAAVGPEFSAKDFRTWGGTLRAAVALAEIGCCEDERQAKRNVLRAVERVSEHLGNTPTVCRSSYVHPKVFECYAAGRTIDEFRPRNERRIRRRQPEYEVEELALLRLLRAKSTA